jgi:TPR repeat protein
LKGAADDSKLTADHENAVVQINYGICFRNGEGVSIHWREATRSHKLAADQGNAVAQTNYELCLRNAKGISIDLKNVPENDPEFTTSSRPHMS